LEKIQEVTAMSRKAQGLSMNVIIIAAIALLVLVILAVIFIGRMGTTTRGIDQCKGVCVESQEDCTVRGPYYQPATGVCPEDEPVCCVGV
jgi:hypothetical protein